MEQIDQETILETTRQFEALQNWNGSLKGPNAVTLHVHVCTHTYVDTRCSLRTCTHYIRQVNKDMALNSSTEGGSWTSVENRICGEEVLYIYIYRERDPFGKFENAQGKFEIQSIYATYGAITVAQEMAEAYLCCSNNLQYMCTLWSSMRARKWSFLARSPIETALLRQLVPFCFTTGGDSTLYSSRNCVLGRYRWCHSTSLWLVTWAFDLSHL